MANVVFKRGSQSDLNALKSYVDGGFYLTSDTNRLYVAQSSSKLVELNKSITVVSNVNQLPALTTDTSKEVKGNEVEIGQFYYVKAGSDGIKGNILAVCTAIDSGTNAITWTQVNPDTQNENTYTTALSASKNTGSSNANQLVYDIKLTQKKKSVKGGEEVSLSDIVGQLTISSADLTGVTVSVAVDVEAGAVSSNKSQIKASGGGSAGNGFNIAGGNGITLSGGGANDLTISGKTYSASSISADAEGKLSFSIIDEGKESTSQTSNAVLYNTITIDGTSETVYNQGSLGSFYSAGKVNTLISDAKATMDAMTYKGAIATQEALFGISPKPNKGDTYKASADIILATDVSAKAGDLIIFNAADGSDPDVAANWDVIPSGDEIDTTYTVSAANNVITLTPSVGSNSSTVSIAGGTALSASTSDNTITLNHKTSGVTAGSYGQAEDETLNPQGIFKVPKITVDAQGHVTAVSDEVVTLPNDSQYALNALSVTGNENNKEATIRLSMTGSGRASGTTTSTLILSSDTLSVVKEADNTDGNEVVINLEWGTF